MTSRGLEFRYERKLDEKGRTLSLAALTLTVDGAEVWYGGERRWAGFLGFLGEIWKYLLLEEAYPSERQPRRPAEFRKIADRELLSSGSEDRSRLEESFAEFVRRHDLSTGVRDSRTSPFYLVREGDFLIADWVADYARLDFAEAIASLERLGDTIFHQLAEEDDVEIRYFMEKWQNRDLADALEIVGIQTSLSPTQAVKILGSSIASRSSSVRSAALAPEETIILARMMGSDLEPELIREIFWHLQRLPHSKIDLLESASKEAHQILQEAQEQSPIQQGRILATWFRERPDVVNRTGVVNDARILRRWRVPYRMVPLSTRRVDAVSCWGANLGPAVLLNSRGIHCSSLGGRRATIAHEICHLLIDRHHSSLGGVEVFGGKVPSIVEQRARAFAAELLLPQMSAAMYFRQAADAHDAIRRLKKEFRVSAALSAYQILNGTNRLVPINDYSILQSYLDPRKYTYANELPNHEEDDAEADWPDEYIFSSQFTERLKTHVRQAVRDALLEQEDVLKRDRLRPE